MTAKAKTEKSSSPSPKKEKKDKKKKSKEEKSKKSSKKEKDDTEETLDTTDHSEADAAAGGLTQEAVKETTVSKKSSKKKKDKKKRNREEDEAEPSKDDDKEKDQNEKSSKKENKSSKLQSTTVKDDDDEVLEMASEDNEQYEREEEAEVEDGPKLSKRARRSLPNLKNMWHVQHPKIQDSEERARLYLKDAGLLSQEDMAAASASEKKKRKKKENINKKNKTSSNDIDPVLEMNSPQIKFGRLLGATDQRVRHQAVRQLQAYLRARSNPSSFSEKDGGDTEGDNAATTPGGLSMLDLLKLWKGLWFTLYMADKVPVQDELSNQIAKLIWCVAGTEEEDEYAAQEYMDIYGGEYDYDEDEEDDEEEDEDDEEDAEKDDEDDEEVENDEDEEDEDDENDFDVNDEDVTMEVVENTLGKYSDEVDEQEEEEEESDDDDEDDDEDDLEFPHQRGAHLASLFVRTFFRTILREWHKMDKYRVNKFYTLMRYMMHQVYRYMAIRHWNLGIIRLFNDAIYEEVLCRVPNGVRNHLIDVGIEELVKVSTSGASSKKSYELPPGASSSAPCMPLTEATFIDCMEPFFALAQTGGGCDDSVQKRSVENVLMKFLQLYSVVRMGEENKEEEQKEDEKDSEDADKKDDKKPVLDQVHVGTIAEFIFGIASDPDTLDRYRKSLYDVHKEYVRRLKLVGRDVDLSQQDEDEDEDDGHACGKGCGHDHQHEAGDEEEKGTDKKEDELEEEDDKESADDGEEGRAGKGKKKKKRDKKKKEAKKSSKHDDDTEDAKEKESEDQAMKEDEKPAVAASAAKDTTMKHTEENAAQKKKKRRKKNKKDKDGDDDNKDEKEQAQKGTKKEEDTPVKDEEICISVKDQKKAKGEMKRKEEEAKKKQTISEGDDQPWNQIGNKKKDKKRSKEESDKEAAEAKRVKFLNINKARSWRASMNGLRTMEAPVPANRTPEKGILLNKGAKVKVSQAAKNDGNNRRRRAVDYFR